MGAKPSMNPELSDELVERNEALVKRLLTFEISFDINTLTGPRWRRYVTIRE